jgi:hypothetical protein
MVKPTSISTLFDEEPIQWGLRGDPYLWRDMKQQLINIRCPDSIEKFTEIIETAFQELTGCPISHQDFIGIEKYSHGGMSSGCVDPAFWREKAIPLPVRKATVVYSFSGKKYWISFSSGVRPPIPLCGLTPL